MNYVRPWAAAIGDSAWQASGPGGLRELRRAGQHLEVGLVLAGGVTLGVAAAGLVAVTERGVRWRSSRPPEKINIRRYFDTPQLYGNFIQLLGELCTFSAHRPTNGRFPYTGPSTTGTPGSSRLLPGSASARYPALRRQRSDTAPASPLRARAPKLLPSVPCFSPRPGRRRYTWPGGLVGRGTRRRGTWRRSTRQ